MPNSRRHFQVSSAFSEEVLRALCDIRSILFNTSENAQTVLQKKDSFFRGLLTPLCAYKDILTRQVHSRTSWEQFKVTGKEKKPPGKKRRFFSMKRNILGIENEWRNWPDWSKWFYRNFFLVCIEDETWGIVHW